MMPLSLSRLVGCALALSLSGCAATRIVVPPPTGDTVTLLVPGFWGSFLETDTPEPERAWLTVGQSLFQGDRSLALPFPGQRPAPAYGPLRPEGPFTRLVAPFMTVDAYGSFLEYGRDHYPGLVPFAYDWRDDIRKSADALCARIEQLVAEGRHEVNIVAHSMGGLVTLQCLLRGRQPGNGHAWAGAGAVKHVIFVATPFGGVPGLFEDMLQGSKVARNRTLLPPAALFSFASAFQLLPPRGDFLVDANDRPSAWNALDAASWWTHGWGVFADPTLREDAAYRAWLQHQLQAHQALSASLLPAEAPAPPPFEVLVVVGTGRPAKSAFRVVGDQVDLEHPVREDGDETVLLSSALPRLPMDYRRLDSSGQHMTLLADRDVLHAIERFLQGQPVGTPVHAPAK